MIKEIIGLIVCAVVYIVLRQLAINKIMSDGYETKDNFK
jgi:hypothetical protein